VNDEKNNKNTIYRVYDWLAHVIASFKKQGVVLFCVLVGLLPHNSELSLILDTLIVMFCE
jgi:hypothetical protein